MNKLTKAEEEIMQIIWRLGPCTVSDVRDDIEKTTGQPKPPHSSISTIVRILDEKGFLTHKTYGRTYEYRPLVSKTAYSKLSLEKLVTDYFDGSMERLVSFMAREKDLKPDDLTELLDSLEEEEN